MTQPQQVRSPCVVVPGNYDGVHRGHRALLRAAREAGTEALPVVALTFDPHPARVLAPAQAPAQLTTLTRRIELLNGCGADEVRVQRFDRAFASLEPERFARQLLRDGLKARLVVVGPDFRFGAGRAGTAEVLRGLGDRLGFSVLPVPSIRAHGLTVSSSAIRDAIARSDLALATRMLGRHHDVTGTVVEGNKRGRDLGFPTANVVPEPVLLPPDGVYAVLAQRLSPGPGPVLPAVANLGLRPTFKAGRSLEVHLLDFDQDLYGCPLRVAFVEYLRAEQRFDGVQSLRAQIRKDV